MSFETNESFSILFVCTGNICRSPLGEHLLKAKLNESVPQASVSSAGTHAMLGGNIPQEILSFALEQKVTILNHEPRSITAGIIGNSDLILTAERSHRSEVVSLVPRASSKSFTLNQFARLALQHEESITEGTLAQPQVKNLSELISELADFRSIATPPDQLNNDDIDDPFRKSLSDYKTAGEEILKAVDITATILKKYNFR